MSHKLSSGHLRFVRHATEYPHPKWYFGLDLGQRQDYSALVAAGLSWSAQGRNPVTFEYQFEPRLDIRLLKRFPLGISYEDLYNLVNENMRTLTPANVASELIIDAGGPGPPFVDRLRSNLTMNTSLRPVIITGGKGANTLSGGYTGVPRRSIISNLRLLLAARSLKCDAKLEGYEILEEELLELAASDSQPESTGAHDDLAIAAGLIAWAAIRDTPELLPEAEDARRKDSRPSLFGPGRLF